MLSLCSPILNECSEVYLQSSELAVVEREAQEAGDVNGWTFTDFQLAYIATAFAYIATITCL